MSGEKESGRAAGASAKGRTRADASDEMKKKAGTPGRGAGKKAPRGGDSANPRSMALSSIVKWRRAGKYANLEVAASLRRTDPDGKDRALYTALVYGTVERWLTLDHVLASLSSRPVDSLDDETHCAVNLGLYQLMYMDRIPDHAAVSETVAVSPRRCRAFVNAILRSFIRAGKRFELPNESVAALSVKYSMPVELVSLFAGSYPDRYESLIAATLARRPMTLRVNTLRISVAEALAMLGDGAVVFGGSSRGGVTCGDTGCGEATCGNANGGGLVPDMVTVYGGSGTVLDGISRGLWFVQDASSRMAAAVLGAQPGSLVVDCCAAPGGKSFSAAIDMGNRGDVRSFDLHENKLTLIREGARRLGIGIITAAARDARRPDVELAGRADYVLCDVPCSGLGVIAKKPDIKYRDVADFSHLPEVQYDILAASSEYVRPGGRLVYSTCTLNRAENESVFTRFLSEHPDFHAVDFVSAGKRSAGGMLTFFPDEGEWDGFFVAAAVRSE